MKVLTIEEARTIYKGATICEGATIYKGAIIYEGATICKGAIICEGATICEGAMIYEGATICKGAVICEGAIIKKSEHHIVVGALGNTKNITAVICDKKGLVIKIGYFEGNLKQAREIIAKKYKDEKHPYYAAIDLVESWYNWESK